MSQFTDSRNYTAISGSAWNKGIRLTIGTDQALYTEMGKYNQDPIVFEIAGASAKSVATGRNKCFAAGEQICVRLHRGGSSQAVANGPIDAGATIYAASGGKIAASGSVAEGHALEAATADGDIIECIFH